MKTSLLFLCCLFFSPILFAQNQSPYAYSNAFILDNQPTSVMEYSYDYDSQISELVENHTLQYNSNGLLIEHVKSNEGISSWYQTFRNRFQYDSKSRLVYFWNEQFMFSNYESQNEQQWIFDSQDMITEMNDWAVVNGDKSLDGDSYKRIITRDNENKVLKIEKSIYTYSFDLDAYTFILDKEYTYKYDANNELDSIIVYGRNITLGGVMKLVSKQYNFDFKNYNATNTDLLEYNSYQISNYNGVKTNVVNTYDGQGRILTQTEKYVSNGSSIDETSWMYEADKITKTGFYEKEIQYLDASSRPSKTETYSYNGTDWELDYVPPYYERTFDDGKLVSDLYKNYYDANTETYKNDTRYEYQYAMVSTGILTKQSTNVVVLYPNPSTGIVNVNGLQNIQKLSIASINGITISLPLQEQIDLSGLAPGVYVVTAEYNNQSSDIQRLIVK